jgi:hypothetical protein
MVYTGNEYVHYCKRGPGCKKYFLSKYFCNWLYNSIQFCEACPDEYRRHSLCGCSNVQQYKNIAKSKSFSLLTFHFLPLIFFYLYNVKFYFTATCFLAFASSLAFLIGPKGPYLCCCAGKVSAYGPNG